MPNDSGIKRSPNCLCMCVLCKCYYLFFFLLCVRRGDWLNKDTIKMMNDLSEEEKKLDELIESCTRAIHGICVDEQTSRYPLKKKKKYFTHWSASMHACTFWCWTALSGLWNPPYSLTMFFTFAYVTYEDIQSIPFMREQTVLVVKGPEDTKLDVTHPKEVRFVSPSWRRHPVFDTRTIMSW